MQPPQRHPDRRRFEMRAIIEIAYRAEVEGSAKATNADRYMGKFMEMVQ